MQVNIFWNASRALLHLMSMHIKECDAIVNKSNLQTSLQDASDIFVLTFKVQHMDSIRWMECYVHKYNEKWMLLIR